MQHGVIAKSKGGRPGRSLQEGIDLGFAEHLGQALTDFGGIEICQGIEGECPLLDEKLEKGAQCSQPSGIGAGTDPAFVAITEIILDLFPGYLGEGRFLKAEKRSEISLIRGHRIGGQSSLDGEILQKTLQQFKPVINGRSLERGIKKTPVWSGAFFINRDFSSD